ncbi:tRNA lysidine(34) synthetase TilS [Actinomadura madurae]|uniref:tRNA lysidine(34) synthetase TilS n=1 Tax=Actinomadura madurae TaxID=1993 RepID=UPI0020D245BE|nr:tRNA lysidine(34) synthetase TilS [Actinomadura madurae]MCP9952751.1 tRNA lysidine(34) synthetase TilS [Actinomadura madurae]MCP9969516.1 tRNA lysidine(34) synthetase TilS [Actinomadura madurae]MCP9981969.1 tRNA lysidine(34) synthetase TilS [Actinomadura madurae]MCQ0006502.1 tRNA lysidine(34) synthetase TilS [Actinomadura madurae]MCQ0018206.1 tRNA lysidine(34) synthetase TilS [Actinomadura madurae]
MGPDPAVAAVRLAVRQVLSDLPQGAMVLAACSGGADSLALAAALAFEAPRAERTAGGVTIDHGLQDGSAERADAVVRTMADLGLDPSGSVAVTVEGPGGPENAARVARYAALDDAAARWGASAVLLGHTRDDQAETVLLGLARGSGARSLSGMPSTFRRAQAAVLYARPLLELDRATTRRACEAMGLEPWDDPHNVDPAYARVRVRHEALPALEKALGPGVAEALARTAGMLRDDADALDELASRAFSDLETTEDEYSVAMALEGLEGLPRAVRTRVLRMAAVKAGSPPGTLAAVHVDAMDRLVTAWRGQRHVDLPGRLRAVRRYGKLLFVPV